MLKNGSKIRKMPLSDRILKKQNKRDSEVLQTFGLRALFNQKPYKLVITRDHERLFAPAHPHITGNRDAG